jgi:hypothetical protein
MTVYLLYNKATAAERKMAALAQKLEEAGVSFELVDADSPRGIDVAQNYDVMARPAIILTSHDGSVLEVWPEEDRFPSVQELSYRDRA